MIDRVILDFDHTLFDTEAFKRELARTLESLGIAPDLFWATYPQVLGQNGYIGYRVADHLRALRRRASFDVGAAERELQAVVARGPEFLFPDAVDFLNRMVSLAVPLTLLSRGDEEFQRAKISASGIERFFHDIHVTPERKQTLLPLAIRPTDHTVFFVNGHLEETVEIVRAFPALRPVLKRRPNFPPERYLHVGMLNFSTLTEIRDYLTIVHAMGGSQMSEVEGQGSDIGGWRSEGGKI